MLCDICYFWQDDLEISDVGIPRRVVRRCCRQGLTGPERERMRRWAEQYATCSSFVDKTDAARAFLALERAVKEAT